MWWSGCGSAALKSRVRAGNITFTAAQRANGGSRALRARAPNYKRSSRIQASSRPITGRAFASGRRSTSRLNAWRFVHWFTCGAIDESKEGEIDGYPKWWKLSEATRKDYLAAYDYLRDEFDMVLRDIKQPDLYETRDTCANKKWPRFADKMISALSSMFKQAVKRGKMDFNPCLGMDKIHEADPEVEFGNGSRQNGNLFARTRRLMCSSP